MTEIRVLLVDDNPDFLEGVSAWLASEPGIEIVGTARTGREAVDRIDRLSPTLVLMDIAIPKMNGLEVTRRIKSKPGAPSVILWSFHDSETVRLEAWGAGADGFVAKSKVTDELTRTIRDLFRDRATGRSKKEELISSLKPGPARDLKS